MENSSYRHPVLYSSELLVQPVRALLHQSQTDITSNPQDGLRYAAAAYDKARIPEVRQADATAAGEAAAKAGLRAEQLGEDLETIQDWFNASLYELREDDPKISRERAGTLLIMGRTFLRRLLHNQEGVGYPRLLQYFEQGESILRSQHSLGKKWDRYGTMHAHYHAVTEAMAGSAPQAAQLAVRGMWRAYRADQEQDDHETHVAFVQKHLKKNMGALALSVTGPFAKSKELQARRLHRARQLVR
jgi:hypothetical protein